MNENSLKKILILAANPKNSTPLRLDQEVREIDEGLTRAKQRDRFELEQKWAVRPRDVQRAILDLAPQIVHFSGHGVGEGGLALEDETGQAKLVSTQAIAGLFELFADQIECVLLNACYSEVQATAIAQHIPYVIGMNQAVGDAAAREFAVGFYDALGAGRNIEFAYKFACNSIHMAGIPEDLTPVLLKKENLALKSLSEPTDQASTPLVARKLISEPGAIAPNSNLRIPTSQSIAVNLEELGGQVPLDSPFYIERPPIEQRCYEAIVKPGALIRIKAPRQMGKSSLVLRILEHATQQGYQTTWLNLQAAGEKSLENLDNLLRWLCSRISRKLGLRDKVEEYWQGALGCNDKCTDYFELYLLEELKVPFALGLDEVDQLFQYEAVASDFFGLLRSWHEESKFNPVWRNLRLILSHSKEVYIPLNINQSPFNVGLPVELPPLNDDQVADLIQRHRLSLSPREAVSLMDLTGGHPYLLRVALYYLVRGEISFAQLIQNAPTAEWAYGEHLRRHLYSLQEHPDLLAAMKRVIASNEPMWIDATEAFKLSSMGLVRFSGNDVVPLCDLYRRYFQEQLGHRTLEWSESDQEAESSPSLPTSRPITRVMLGSSPARQIYISYAWGGESEAFANRLDTAFQARGVTIIRDKRNLGYKGLIKEFMEQIGRGRCVIAVVSDKYLKSPNCMFELVQIAEQGQFYDRIFPIVLPDAQIYRPTERIKYVQHWEDQIRELDAAMRGVSAANLQGFREEIDQYTQIRNTIAELTSILKNMNTLTAEIHQDSDFDELFQTIEAKLAE